MNGIVIIDKPAGWTSQDVTARLRRVFGTRRIGHGGTLDPMATGVLPVFVGRATRGVEFFEHAEKTYETELLLGIATDTAHVFRPEAQRLEAVRPRPEGQAGGASAPPRHHPRADPAVPGGGYPPSAGALLQGNVYPHTVRGHR